MAEIPRQFEHEFRVRSYEVGPDGALPVHRLLDYFQEIATMHADTMEISYREMLSQGLAWVLARVYVQVARLPRMHQTVRFTTWHSGLDRRFARRCFQVRDFEGGLVARGTANWLVIDMSTRTMATGLPEWISRVFEDMRPPELEWPSRTVPKLTTAEVGQGITVRYEDLDANSHVNNTRLAAWLFEPLAGEHAPGRLTSLDVAFRAEARAGDEIVSDCGRQEDGAWLHVLRRLSDGKELVRARTWWK